MPRIRTTPLPEKSRRQRPEHRARGAARSGDGQFTCPLGVALDNAGNVYVADTGNNRIQKFTFEGDFLAAWASFVPGNGGFWPYGLTVDGRGNLYVADMDSSRVLVFANPNPSPVVPILNLLLD